MNCMMSNTCVKFYVFQTSGYLFLQRMFTTQSSLLQGFWRFSEHRHTVEPLYSQHALQRTPQILLIRTNGITAIVSQKNLFIADRNSRHLSIADTTFRNQWQFCIEIYPCIADSHYQSKFIRKLQCFCINKNIIKAYLFNIKSQTDV